MALLADELAERVVRKLIDRQKKALVIVTGAAIGVPTALEKLKELRGEGFTYHVLMTRSAMYVTGEEAVRAALAPEQLWVESADAPPEKVARPPTPPTAGPGPGRRARPPPPSRTWRCGA